jgi:signal transduction histidine kinase
MAHDLRSPLSSILFLADTLRRGQSGETSDLQRKQLGLIYSAALGLAGVVNDVMELAKGGGTLRDEVEQAFSIAQIVNTVLETVGPVAEEKGITLQKDIQVGDHVRGHPISTSRVLLNLVTNALHHTSEGFVAVTVKGTGRNEVIFSVEDTGDGIPEDARGTVFEPFKRGQDRSRMLFSGTGLGLAIARSLVRAMGGEIDFVSEVGRGTRFWFKVPVATN